MDNDTFNPDNPQVPAAPEAPVLDFVERTRARLRAEDGGRASPSTPKVETPPPPTEFEVALKGEKLGVPEMVLNYTGYLIATPNFVGFSNEEGIIVGAVPFDNILYVRPVEGKQVAAAS